MCGVRLAMSGEPSDRDSVAKESMMRRFLNPGSKVWLVAVGMVVTGAARTQHGSPVDLLITRARVVDTRSGAITPGRVIAIRGDTIVAIGDSTEMPRFRAWRT